MFKDEYPELLVSHCIKMKTGQTIKICEKKSHSRIWRHELEDSKYFFNEYLYQIPKSLLDISIDEKPHPIDKELVLIDKRLIEKFLIVHKYTSSKNLEESVLEIDVSM
ncbi:hypothetical protein R7Q39_11595 [Vibrio sp. 947]|uniref:hypothetical protein n=1 Tax=unclassified Vibrio TaxID=2614977 RepID=UPI002963EBA1|nr:MULTISPECIES: hypothetical protein [unclassified Vibrio]MDW1583005.1 hypothetical protein [Vibrio sp. Vb2897]MDW1641267.1 hypothetical protein [Vibrio sp. Vb2896]MDW1926064.1 hypothetical protein [Vibrio sp. 947]